MERRGATRFRLRLEVAFSWRDDAGVISGGEGRSRDLNSRGIYVQSPFAPPLGASVEMNVFLPQTGPVTRPTELHAEGRVVRIDPATTPTDMGGFAAMNHTVILRDSQGRVLENDSSDDFGFRGEE